MSENKNIYLIPGSIIVAGLVVAGAVIFANGSFGGGGSQTITTNNNGTAQLASAENFRAISNSDHIRGDPNAPITIVEFSDFECPFCKRIHPTLIRLIDENTDVKWVFRHFPLTSIHSRAQDAAVASECIARLGGNDAFWEFTDAVFENQSRLGQSLYEEIAEELGIDQEAFRSCFTNRETIAEVQADLNEAITSGGRGTPFSIIVAGDGELIPFSGALPYENIVSLIEQVRSKI